MATYVPAWWTVEWETDAEYGYDVARVAVRADGRTLRVTARYDGVQGDWWIEDEAGNIVLDHQPEPYSRREHVMREALDIAGRVLAGA